MAILNEQDFITQSLKRMKNYFPKEKVYPSSLEEIIQCLTSIKENVENIEQNELEDIGLFLLDLRVYQR